MPEPNGTLRPPPGATPELALILSGISDPSQRDVIVRAWHDLSEGVEDHALTQAAALFAAVLRAYETRMNQGVSTAATAPEKANASELSVLVAGNVSTTLGRLITAQGDRTEAAAKSVNARFLSVALATAFFAGCLVGAWLFHSK